jgi:hypothetical protein
MFFSKQAGAETQQIGVTATVLWVQAHILQQMTVGASTQNCRPPLWDNFEPAATLSGNPQQRQQ